MKKALITWFLLLFFFIFLCLRLESRTHWNWFVVLIPLWIYDFALLADALFHIIIHCKDETLETIITNKNNLLVLVILLKIAMQIMFCLKLEYQHLNLEVYQVLIPFWVLLPILIVDISVKLFKSNNY